MAVSVRAAPATSNESVVTTSTANTTTATAITTNLTAITTTNSIDQLHILSGCNQANCPDHDAPFDYEEYWFEVDSPGPSPPYVAISYFVRVNDCGQCQGIQTSQDGCVDFNSCGRDQNICVDINNSRAHRIWKDNGHGSCYTGTWDIIGDCGLIKQTHIWWPIQEVECTW